jgi:hypothetical protein
MNEQRMGEQPVDPNEQDQHDEPAKSQGDKLQEVVTDDVKMHDEQ